MRGKKLNTPSEAYASPAPSEVPSCTARSGAPTTPCEEETDSIRVFFFSVFALLASILMLPGCGSSVADLLASRVRLPLECEGAAEGVAEDLVVLDWGGGVTPLHAGESFDPMDLSMFELTTGGTLADRAEEFQEQVRQQINLIFCDSPGPFVVVRQAWETDAAQHTRVYLTQALSPVGEKQIGEGEYDPCNRQHDNVAVIFGEQIRQLMGVNSFEAWVTIVANVTAHEIGHTLGYGHIARSQLDAVERLAYVELMLEAHTVDELRREQRFVLSQSNCTLASSDGEMASHSHGAEGTD